MKGDKMKMVHGLRAMPLEGRRCRSSSSTGERFRAHVVSGIAGLDDTAFTVRPFIAWFSETRDIAFVDKTYAAAAIGRSVREFDGERLGSSSLRYRGGELPRELSGSRRVGLDLEDVLHLGAAINKGENSFTSRGYIPPTPTDEQTETLFDLGADGTPLSAL